MASPLLGDERYRFWFDPKFCDATIRPLAHEVMIKRDGVLGVALKRHLSFLQNHYMITERLHLFHTVRCDDESVSCFPEFRNSVHTLQLETFIADCQDLIND